MATKNDARVKKLLTEIDKKKKALGAKPRAALKSNGVLNMNGVPSVNINTISSKEKCVELVTRILLETKFVKDACEFLEIETIESSKFKELNDFLEDLKMRMSIIKYDEEKKKLSKLEKQLKDLRSEDAKTADALDSILAQI